MEVFGRWELESLIAVGGLGEVWQAHRDETVAAVKRLHTHLARNQDILAQFAVERGLTMTLPRHANLVGAHDHGEVDGRPYIALALAPGEELRRAIAAGATLPRARAIAIVAQACEAIAHLHAHGYAHGDVNPGNLVVTEDDRVTVIDLGVARPLGERGPVRGTHAYMAPEQVRGEAWTEATDVFALGVVLWELVAGARLFHRGPSWLSMAAVVEAEVPPLADRAVDAIAQAALAKDPAQRVSSARELAARLRELR